MSDQEVELMALLTRIDTRLETVEGSVDNLNDRLFTGDGDTLVTRLRLAEQNIVTLKRQSDDSKRSKAAIIVALATGIISMLTSIVVAYVSGK